MKELEGIERVYHSRLANHTMARDNNSWDVIQKKMVKKSFFKFSSSRLNIYYVGALSVVSLAAVANYSPIFNFPFSEEETTAPKARIVKELVAPIKEEVFVDDYLAEEELVEPAVVENPSPVDVQVVPEKVVEEPVLANEVKIEETLVETKDDIEINKTMPDNVVDVEAESKIVYVKGNKVLKKDTAVKVVKKRVRRRK